MDSRTSAADGGFGVSLAPGKGIACMLVGGLLLSVNDTILKWLSTEYPVGQVLFMRAVFVIIPIAILAWRGGGLSTLGIRRYRGHALRAVLVVTSSFMFVTALGLMPLADVVAITFAGPLFLTALAPWLLGEKVGWRRWSAVLVGLAGVMLIVRPTGDAVRLVALLPLGTALMGALRDIITRRISVTESTPAILCFTTIAVGCAGLATLPFGWFVPTPGDVALLALCGVTIGCAHYLLIEAFRLAEATLVAPFKYTIIVWAVLFGFIVWGDLPDRWVVGGSAVVIASGLYILHRETRGLRRGRR